MWEGIDPELRRQYDSLRTMVRLSHQSPAKEWPLVFVSEFESLPVIREWPGGEVTDAPDLRSALIGTVDFPLESRTSPPLRQ